MKDHVCMFPHSCLTIKLSLPAKHFDLETFGQRDDKDFLWKTYKTSSRITCHAYLSSVKKLTYIWLSRRGRLRRSCMACCLCLCLRQISTKQYLFDSIWSKSHIKKSFRKKLLNKFNHFYKSLNSLTFK